MRTANEWSRWIGVALGLVLSGLVFLGTATAREYAYDYFDEPIALELDRTRIAVLDWSGVLGGADAELMEFTVRPHVIAGWQWIEFGVPLESDDSVERWVDRFAAQATFASPVFSRRGETLFLTPLLLLQTRASEPLTEADEAVVVVHEREWSGIPGGFRLKARTRSGFELLAASRRIARRDETSFCEPNFVFTGRSTAVFPEDPEFEIQWGLHNTGQSLGTPDVDIDAPFAWDHTLGSGAVRVVIIDAGVELDHPDLNAEPGVDVTSQGPGDGSPLTECDFHGTVVAGPISARFDNGIGVAGIAPECPSVPARTMISDVPCDGTWTSEFQWTVDTLDFALLSGARVTNNSNAYGAPSAAIATKYDQTRVQGVVHFSGTGNTGEEGLEFPGSVASVNAVSAIDRNGDLSDFSTFGAGTAFTAPGEFVRTTDLDGTYRWASGTSIAAPHVAAVAALLFSLDPGMSSFQVENILEATVVDVGAPGVDPVFGAGLVNAGQAVNVVTGGSFFRRADVNADGVHDIADAVASLDQLFGSAEVSCALALDANDDEGIDVADVVFTLSFLFSPSSPGPAFPFSSCGFDPTLGPLTCHCYPGCP